MPSPTVPNNVLQSTPKTSRSFAVLKLRPRSKSTTTNPTLPPSPTKKKSTTVAKRNKARNAYLRPAPLANELELMQFMDGGRLDSHAKRVMHAQARAAAPIYSKSKDVPLPVGDVFRDGAGGLWWDQEEEWEYAHLLANHDDHDSWVHFSDKENAHPSSPYDDRRGSVSTHDSELDPRSIVKPSSEDNLAAFGGAIPPLVLRKPVSSVLARAHSGRTRRPTVSTTLRPLSPRSTTGRFPVSAGASPFAIPKKGKPRRRPAPLKLAPIALCPSGGPWKRHVASQSPVDAEKARRDFLAGSFVPPLAVISPLAAVLPAGMPAPSRLRKKSFANLRNALASEEALAVRKKAANVWALFRREKD